MPSANVSPGLPVPPIARVTVQTDTHFGVQVADPYRWMEEWKSTESQEWLKAQGTHARSVLDSIPERAVFLKRIAELGDAGPSLSDFTVVSGRTFYLRRDPGERTAKLAFRAGSGSPERILLDPNTMPSQTHFSIDWIAPSWDGRRVAYGLSEGGSEESVLHVLDTDTGKVWALAITRTQWGSVQWWEDPSSFLYFRFPERPPGAPVTEKYLDGRIRLHRLGRNPNDDPVVFGRGVNPLVKMAREDFPAVVLSPVSEWMLGLVIHGVLKEMTVYAAPRSFLGKPAETIHWKKVADIEHGVTGLELLGGRIFLKTHRGAPRYKVVALPLANPDWATAETVVPESKAVIQGIRMAAGHVMIMDLDGGLGRLRRMRLPDGKLESVPLPMDGTILEWSGEPDSAEVLLHLTSWTVSPRVYRYRLSDGSLADTGWREPSPVDFSEVESHEVHVPSTDGVLIPLSIIHRRGLKKDGANLALITGYGSYGMNIEPAFTPSMLAWYERGGVYAVAHVRGGGEYGNEWHEAGRGLNKQRTVDDFIACAEYLVNQGYTHPERLAGSGTSAGGITAGGALVQRPELWAAIILRVADTNALRSEFMESGPANIPEFGSVATEEGFRALQAMDAYSRVKPQAHYPATLITTGVNDPRVSPWQAMKMAARLQAASITDPVLLRVDFSSGHGMGSTKQQRDEELADQLAFLWWVMGRSALPARSGPSAEAN